MHAKTDSEVTSNAASSPGRSPQRAVYYVQSPSRDSHDGEKTATSLHSTPVISPAGSPPHSHSQSSVGRHSRESSSSRFSGSLKPGSRKILPNDGARGGGGGGRKGNKAWKEFTVIEEEGLLDNDETGKGLSRRCYILIFIVGFIVLFSFFSLILWAASHNKSPTIAMKSISFENFIIQAGTDATGVPTDMATMNSSVMLTFRNTANFFGLHVSSTPLDLSYSQLTLASGNINNFYQSRKSQRSINVVLLGNRVPLYGGGSSLSSNPGKSNVAAVVPLSLNFTVRSTGYVLGQLVKPNFNIGIRCSFVMDLKKMNSPVSLAHSCQQYD